MKSKTITILGLALAMGAMFGASAASAEDDSVETMAVILVDINHVPTDAQKETLKGIANNTAASDQERTVANAITNLNHKASAADKDKLKPIMEDQAASAALREVAGEV